MRSERSIRWIYLVLKSPAEGAAKVFSTSLSLLHSRDAGLFT